MQKIFSSFPIFTPGGFSCCSPLCTTAPEGGRDEEKSWWIEHFIQESQWPCCNEIIFSPWWLIKKEGLLSFYHSMEQGDWCDQRWIKKNDKTRIAQGKTCKQGHLDGGCQSGYTKVKSWSYLNQLCSYSHCVHFLCFLKGVGRQGSSHSLCHHHPRLLVSGTCSADLQQHSWGRRCKVCFVFLTWVILLKMKQQKI